MISTDLSSQLHAEFVRLPEAAWQLEAEDPEVRRKWAEVPYVPDDGDYRKNRACTRWSCCTPQPCESSRGSA